MSLSNGRQTLAIPGPSVIPDRVLQAMHRAAPNIYEGELIEMVPGIARDLKAVAGTQHHVAMYIGNGHAAWEAAIANVFSRGDAALALVTGFFTEGWTAMAERMGVEARRLDFGKQAALDPAAVTAALRADTGRRIKAVLCVQVDTASSVRNDIPALRAAIDAADHPALLMVDAIACLGCDEMRMDAWGVDVLVAGCQKGLMTPPGMAFVFFNDRADALREGADCVTHYWDWRPRAKPGQGFYQYFDGTAPTHHLYGLREALAMIAEEGIGAVWARHATLAKAVWAAFDTWGQVGPLRLNIADPGFRSHAVTAAHVGAPMGSALREWCDGSAGLTLGIGLGMTERNDPAWHGYFRIGHMGHVNAHMMLGTLATIEAGMGAVGIAHQPGGATAAAQVIAAATRPAVLSVPHASAR